MPTTPATGHARLRRRTILGFAGIGLTQPGLTTALSAQDAGGLGTLWTRWRDRFLTRAGRVVDPEQGGISHSEGQGYGLLLAQAAGDEAAFRRIEDWTRANLLVREDALMAWRWSPGAGVQGDDWHNATDGDLFRAWALLRADRDSGWRIDRAACRKITRDLSASCLWPDPRAASELLLRPSAEAQASAERVLLNPSYIMPRALRELGTDAADDRLVRAAEHGLTCLGELAREDRLPDWIDVTKAGYAAPAGHELRSSYDALRIPLYLLWSGHGTHPAVGLARARLDDPAHSGRVIVARDADGRIVATSDLPGYRALADLIDCRARARPDAVDGPYYPASLLLLARLARREGQACDHA